MPTGYSEGYSNGVVTVLQRFTRSTPSGYSQYSEGYGVLTHAHTRRCDGVDALGADARELLLKFSALEKWRVPP